jgi:hypothetical protein
MEENTKIQNFESKNILEEFYELIEKHRLSTNNSFELGNFYDYLSEFDEEYQNFNNKNNERTNKSVYSQLIESLYPFLVIFKFKGFSNRPIFYSFKRFIKFYTLILSEINGVRSEFFFWKNISENFPSLTKGDFVELINSVDFNLNLISPKNYDDYNRIVEFAENNISEDFGLENNWFSNKIGETEKQYQIFTNTFQVLEYSFDSKNFEFKMTDNHYEMTVDLRISVEDNDAQRLSGILFQILTSLSNVNSNKTTFEYISVGSLHGRIKVWMKDIVANEETKAILETTKEAVSKGLTAGQVSHSATKKQSAETNKIKSEQKLIEKELTDKPSDFEVKMSNALDLEKKALENEKLKNEIVKERLEIIEKLSDLSAKGIIEADMVRIDINEVLYILKEGNELKETGIDIDDIA